MGYPEWDGSRGGRDQQPETGRWDLRQERWIPQQRGPEDDDFGIGPFPARSNGGRPGEGRVLDYDEYRTGERTGQHRTGEWATGDRTGERTGQHRRYPSAVPASTRRRPHLPVPPPPPPSFEDDEDEYEEDEGTNYIGSFLATAGWYLVPILGYAAWALTLSADPRPGCINAFGLPCPAPREEALSNLLDNGPQFAGSLALSIAVAMFLGWATSGWRPMAIGFASAVLGAGVATVLFAVLATQF
ncbi:hypothetical protein ACFFX1_24975 [Dactylosporangium sucinum]|uniref:hypothetical protein n=1 Tax=Dactylosporangium sucinum TaxID=1424081 RepID=UPI00167D2082|nr:hypothetical protein [Dactylosporangium sucinum]